jgi:hypothetical protein
VGDDVVVVDRAVLVHGLRRGRTCRPISSPVAPSWKKIDFISSVCTELPAVGGLIGVPVSKQRGSVPPPGSQPRTRTEPSQLQAAEWKFDLPGPRRRDDLRPELADPPADARVGRDHPGHKAHIPAHQRGTSTSDRLPGSNGEHCPTPTVRAASSHCVPGYRVRWWIGSRAQGRPTASSGCGPPAKEKLEDARWTGGRTLSRGGPGRAAYPHASPALWRLGSPGLPRSAQSSTTVGEASLRSTDRPRRA